MTAITEHFPDNASEEDSRLFNLRQELNIQPASVNSDGSPAWTICDPVRQEFYRIGWFEFTILSQWKGGENVSDLVVRINANTSVNVDKDEVLDLQKFLFNNNLLHITDEKYTEHLLKKSRGGAQSYFKTLLHHYLFIRIPLVKPDRFLDKTLPIAEKFYNKNIAIGLLISFFLGLFLISRQWDSFQDSFSSFLSFEGALAYGVAIIFVKILHELGHAYTAKHYGLKVPTMGVAFMVMWPVLYTDTTDSWRLTSQRQRLNIVAAGMMVELSLAVIATLLWSFLPEGIFRSMAFMVASVSWVMTLAVNLNPFMRFDGYYLLSDLLDTPNLQDRSFALAKWWLRRLLFGIGETPEEWYSVRNPKILIAYAIGTWIYRALLFIGIAALVYYVFFKPLGFFLMAVEIGVFILQPVIREISVWISLKDSIKWNRATKRSASLLALFLLLFIIPWQQHSESIAVLRPIHYTQIYSPESARITRINKTQSELVKQGDVIIELESPELNTAYNKAALQVKMLSLQLSRVRTVEQMIEFSELTSERLSESQTELQALEGRRASLKILAEFDGKVLAVDETLRVGRWVNSDLPLMQLTDDSRLLLETYVSENVVSRLINENARFYSNTGIVPPFNATIVSIDAASTRDMKSPWFIQSYGGDIIATPDSQGRMRTESTVYKVILEPSQMITLTHIERGIIQIPVESESLLGRFWRFALSVVLRESGF